MAHEAAFQHGFPSAQDDKKRLALNSHDVRTDVQGWVGVEFPDKGAFRGVGLVGRGPGIDGAIFEGSRLEQHFKKCANI